MKAKNKNYARFNKTVMDRIDAMVDDKDYNPYDKVTKEKVSVDMFDDSNYTEQDEDDDININSTAIARVAAAVTVSAIAIVCIIIFTLKYI